jgi:pyridoxal biosynthesis lyase PdxS
MIEFIKAMGSFPLSVCAELGSDVPSDAQLLTKRVQEGGSAGSGIFDIAVPPVGIVLRPVERVPREKFGRAP